MPDIRRQAFAYITHGGRLLVFRHVDFPEAGIQVPAGTLEEGESPEEAALREAREETGLESLEVRAFLGQRDFAWKDLVFHRWFYHLACTSTPPERWHHDERHAADGSGPIRFELFWAQLPDGVPPLHGEHDALLTELMRRLA